MMAPPEQRSRKGGGGRKRQAADASPEGEGGGEDPSQGEAEPQEPPEGAQEGPEASAPAYQQREVDGGGEDQPRSPTRVGADHAPGKSGPPLRRRKHQPPGWPRRRPRQGPPKPPTPRPQPRPTEAARGWRCPEYEMESGPCRQAPVPYHLQPPPPHPPADMRADQPAYQPGLPRGPEKAREGGGEADEAACRTVSRRRLSPA